MTKILEGRRAIVTGAGSGIGRDLCVVMGAAGATVGIAVRRPESGKETAELVRAAGGTAIVLPMDVTDEAAVTQGVALFTDAAGGLDIMVHNANNNDSAQLAPGEQISRERWLQQGMVTNAGAFLTARAAYPHLRASPAGRMVLMTSTFGYHGAAMNAIYSAQKAGYRALVKSLAREWGPDGITVNAIAPAAATDATTTFFSRNPAMRDAYLQKFALGHMGDTHTDIGMGVVALCSDMLQYLTGQTLFLDGGLYVWA